jgi:hypothetical protein
MSDNDLISRMDLYEKTAEWEAQALHMVELHMRDDDKAEWRKWSTVLAERSAFKHDVADAPAVDAKPVVLCKDCKHYNNGWCYNPNTYDDEKTRGNTVPDWYCADGERREVNDER